MPERQNDDNVFLKTLVWITDKLNSSEVPYMITGGAALGFWGQVRTTMDLDIVIKPPAAKIDVFINSLKTDADINVELVKQCILGKKMFHVFNTSTLFRVDMIPLKPENYEQVKFNNRIEIKFQDHSFHVISPEDLIISKLQWSKSIGGSELHLKDCESVYKLNLKNLKTDYLNTWTVDLRLQKDFDKLR